MQRRAEGYQEVRTVTVTSLGPGTTARDHVPPLHHSFASAALAREGLFALGMRAIVLLKGFRRFREKLRME